MNSAIAYPLDIQLPQHNAAQIRILDRHVVPAAQVQAPRHVARDRDPQDLAVREHALNQHGAAYHGVRQHVQSRSPTAPTALRRSRAMPA
jgi:hypothetical protein